MRKRPKKIGIWRSKRNATSDHPRRVHVVLLVKLHDLHVHFLRILFVLLANLFHWSLEEGHFFASDFLRANALGSEWPKRELDDNREQDDRHAPVADPAVKEVHYDEEWFAHPADEAELHSV